MTTTALVLFLLAAWRLGRLLAIDELIAPLRNWIAGRKPNGPVAYLVTCSWCISIWSSAALAIPTVLIATDLGFWLDGAWLALLLALAGSLACGFGQTVEDRLDL